MPIDPYTAWEMAQTAINLAPKIAEGAQKLWSITQKKSESVVSPAGSDIDKDASSNLAKSKVASAATADAAIQDLQTEMLAATDLIKALAAQNAQFAKNIELSRFQFEAYEKQSGLLAKCVESADERLKVLDSQNARLAKDVEDTRDQLGAIETQSSLLVKRIESTDERLKVLDSQNAGLAKDLEDTRHQLEALEKQNSILLRSVESGKALMKNLEAKNAQFAIQVELERVRARRLTGICIAIGVVAVAGLAMAIRLSLQ